MGWIVGIFFFVAFIFMGAIGFFLYKVIRKSTKKHSPAETEKVISELKQKTREMIPDLPTWDGMSYEDLSVSMRYSYSKGFAHRMKGKIHTISNKPVVAFNRYERGLYSDGYVAAANSEFEYFFEIQKGKTFDIWLNDKKLGQIREDGSIYDTSKQKVGHAKHPTKVSVNIGFVQGRAGDTSFPLTMNGRKLADILVAPNHGGGNTDAVIGLNENNYGIQTLRNVDAPTAEEEKWLLAMAILETAFHGHWMV